MKKFIGVYNRSIILPFLCLLFSSAGIYFISDHRITMLCLIAVGVCRHFSKRAPIDKEQFSLFTDAMFFLAFPAMFVLYYITNPIGILIASIYMLCGIIRLTWVNALIEENDSLHGLPIHYASLVFPLTNLFYNFGGNVIVKIILCFIYLIMSFLFIWDVKIKKPGKTGYLILNIIVFAIAVTYIVKICIWPLY